jgi:multidrug efflux pump subunit AcrA (membrane-fusion protein)
VTLTEDAARRLDIQTAAIRESMVNGRLRTVLPYAAVMYDTEGGTWVYTSPEALVFLRNRIEVDFINGDLAVLSSGPSSGTSVVTVGATELYGSELEFEEE